MIMPQNVPDHVVTLQIVMFSSIEFQPSLMCDLFKLSISQMTCECNNSSEVPCTMFLLYMYFFHRISAKFYVVLSATFLNFQCSSRSSYLVNLMTPQNLPALCCNFTRIFFTWNTSIFLNFQTSPRSGCMLNMTTP